MPTEYTFLTYFLWLKTAFRRTQRNTLPSLPATSYTYEHISFTSHIEASDSQAQQNTAPAPHMCCACRPGAAAVGIELIKVQPSKNIQVSRVQRFVRCRSSELQLSLSATENTQGPSRTKERTYIARASAVRVVISVHVVFSSTYRETSYAHRITTTD